MPSAPSGNFLLKVRSLKRPSTGGPLYGSGSGLIWNGRSTLDRAKRGKIDGQPMLAVNLARVLVSHFNDVGVGGAHVV